MVEGPFQRGERLWAGEGIEILATNEAERLILTFEEAAVCEVAHRIQVLLKRHALASSFLERLDSRSFLIRRVDPLPLQVVVESAQGESQVSLEASDGQPLTHEEAAAALDLPVDRVAGMADVATHAARSLRAHLSLRGVESIRVVLRFGLDGAGAVLLQVVNPLGCDLGTDEMARLAEMLGG